MTMYQKVRRKLAKVAVVEVTRNSGLEVVTLGKGCSLSSVSGFTTENPTSVDLTSSPSTNSLLPSSRLSSASSLESKKSEDKKPAAKIYWRTSKEVQRAHAKVAQITESDNKQVMKQATVMIDRCRGLPRNHPDMKSITTIVEETSCRLQANIFVKSAARYVRDGLIGVSPLKRGLLAICPFQSTLL
jgi:hypothetical protein